MAEEEENPAPAAEEVIEGPKKLSKKKLILFLVLLLALLGGGGGVAFFMMHKKEPPKDEKSAELKEAGKKDANAGPGFYYDVPDILVNMNDTSSKPRYLKLSMSLELPSKEDQPKLEAVMPRITDNFQTYLRELRVDDLRGSAGIYRLRLELLARVRAAADPVVVRDVLFREILVQ
jgi:flagellar FliL protein